MHNGVDGASLGIVFPSPLGALAGEEIVHYGEMMCVPCFRVHSNRPGDMGTQRHRDDGGRDGEALLKLVGLDGRTVGGSSTIGP